MDTYCQYRTTVNGQESAIENTYPSDRWSRIAETSGNRTMTAILERRLVSQYQPGIEKLYPGMTCDNLYISHWSTLAEIESR